MPIEFPEMLTAFWAENSRVIINIVLLIALTWLLLVLIAAFFDRLKRRIAQTEVDQDRLARLMTIENVASNALRGLILAVAIFTFLGLIGFNLAPLLASAGIAGLAVSLGAQSLIKDFIGGILIVVENQFGVGDLVEIGDARGTVEKITLRTVSLREVTGRLHIISNGDIRVVTNSSRDWIRAAVDLYVPFDADVGTVSRALEEAVQKVWQDEEARALMLEAPQVSGWNDQNEWGVQIRIAAKVKVGEKFTVEGLLRQHALESLRRGGIHLAVPSQEVVVKGIPGAL